MEHTRTMSRRTFVCGTVSLGVAASFLSAFPTTAFAVTSAEKKAEAAAAYEKLTGLEEALDTAEADYGSAVLEQQEAQGKMEEAQGRIDEASEKIADLQDQLAVRARGMYRSGSLSVIDLLLGATSFQAFSTNWDVLSQMNENDSKLVEDTKKLRLEVEAEKEEYAAQEKIAAEKAEEARQVQAQAQQLVSEMRSTYETLSAEAAELLQQEEAAREAERQRQAEEALRRQQQAANSGGGGMTSTGGSGPSSGGSGGHGNINNNKPFSVSPDIILQRARNFLGRPYVWGAVGPDAFDCSGFVGYCLKGTHQRHWTTYQIYYWTRVTDPQPGDICISWTHTGIYVGGGRMIHASSFYNSVIEAPVQSNMFFVRY